MRLIPTVIVLALALPARAGDWGKFDIEFEEAKPWTELQAQLPAAPKPESLVAIDIGAAIAHRVYVDKASVSSAGDGVVRYSVLIKATGGAQTVNYEGMRCESGEAKIYAFGRPDGSWVRNKYARWSRIQDRASFGYQRELFYHYFCTVDGRAEMKVIDQALRTGGLRRGESPPPY
jgi:hypothetical protein